MQTKLSFHFIVVLSLLLAALPAQAAPAASAAPADLLQFTAGGHALGFAADGMYATTGTHALHVNFAGANAVRPQADSPANPSPSLRTGSDGKAASLSQVTYADLWNGIGLTYTAEAGRIYTTTYTLAPGADPTDIRLRYNAPLTVNEDGTLSTAFETGTLTESAPLAWQEIQGQRVNVDVSFQIHEQEVGFALGSYDPLYALTIDPSLTWNTFLGGSGDDKAGGIAVDGSGNVYVTGESDATWGSPVRAFTGGNDAFAAKLNSSGMLTWSTFLGGSGYDQGNSIATDGSGGVYVTGFSDAAWGNPVSAYAGSQDAFAAKLNSSGVLTWNTFLGGGGYDGGYGIAVDGSENVYVTGYSSGTWGSPVSAYTGGYDAFAARLNSAGSLTWNTFLGGSGYDGDYGIAVDGSGNNVYVAGISGATWGSPVRAFTGGYDAFAAKLNSSGVLTWNTFLGGSGYDKAGGIAVDGSGNNVYVAGFSSATWGSPVRAYTSSDDAFAAKLNSSGALSWNTFLGGSGDDEGYGIAVDGSGNNVYVAGISSGTWGNPVSAYFLLKDASAAKLDSSGVLTWNTFLGGSGDDEGFGIVVDGSGNNVYVAGGSSGTWGSPVRAYGGGSEDAFAAKVDLSYRICLPLVIR